MKTAQFITIPKSFIGNEELVIMPRKILKRLIGDYSEEDILALSREAKNLKKIKKLSLLRSLKEWR